MSNPKPPPKASEIFLQLKTATVQQKNVIEKLQTEVTSLGKRLAALENEKHGNSLKRGSSHIIDKENFIDDAFPFRKQYRSDWDDKMLEREQLRKKFAKISATTIADAAKLNIEPPAKFPPIK